MAVCTVALICASFVNITRGLENTLIACASWLWHSVQPTPPLCSHNLCGMSSTGYLLRYYSCHSQRFIRLCCVMHWAMTDDAGIVELGL